LDIWLEPAVDDDDLIKVRVELGADCQQRERHRKKYRARVVKHYFEPLCGARCLGAASEAGAGRRHGVLPGLVGSSLKTASRSLTKRRSASTEIAKPRLRNSSRNTHASPKLESTMSAAPPGLRCSRRAAAKRSATSDERQARS